VDGTRAVEITYRVRNGTRFFSDYDEFYWNVTGNDWPVPIDHASANLHLPGTAAGSLRAQAFTGAYGSAERDARATVNGADAQFETNSPLPMAGWDDHRCLYSKGIFKQPSVLTKLVWFIGGNPVVFLPLVTLAVMFALWCYKGAIRSQASRLRRCMSRLRGSRQPRRRTLLDDAIILALPSPRLSK